MKSSLIATALYALYLSYIPAKYTDYKPLASVHPLHSKWSVKEAREDPPHKVLVKTSYVKICKAPTGVLYKANIE